MLHVAGPPCESAHQKNANFEQGFINFDQLLRTYNFFSGMEADYSYMSNAIIGSSKDHPVILKTIDIIKRNLLTEDIPDYTKYPCNAFTETLFKTAMMPITVAFYQAGNKEENIDISFNNGIVFGHNSTNVITQSDSINFNSSNISTFGFHHFSTSWLKAGESSLFIYDHCVDFG